VQKGIFVLLLLVLAGHLWGQSPKGTSRQLLFTIDKKPVYTDEFTYLYKKNHLKPDDFTEQKVNEYLDLFTHFKLKVAEAKARGLDTTETFRKEFSTYREELKKPYLAEANEVDRLTREVYQRLLEEVLASHILLSVRPEATPADTLAVWNRISALRERIMKGEDFEKLAKETSEDPSSKTNGGSLGYFTALQMVYPFEQAAFTLKVGEVSKPVRTRFGYHLIKVFDRRPSRGEVEVSHIILRATPNDNNKVKNKIMEIYEQLQGGRSWDELCKEYSEDAATKDTGGRLRPFGVGAIAGVPEFEAVAFSLKEPGEVSDPFKSGYGWHIIRLERKIPVPPFADVEQALKRKVARDERVQVADRRLMEAKKRKFGFTEVPEVKAAVWSSIDTSLQKGRWRFKGDASIKSKTLFTIDKVNHNAGEFISFVEKNQQPLAEGTPVSLDPLYETFVHGKIGDVEEAKLIKSNPDYGNMLTEYREGILLFTIMEKEVWNKAPDDTSALRTYYRANRDKYKAGERVRAKIFAATDKNFMEQVKKKVAAGDSIKGADLKRFTYVQPLRSYERGDSKAVDKTPWTIGVHSVDVNETYYLVEIESLVPPGPKSFEEARAQVISDYQDVLEKSWVAQLKQKYAVKINNKGKKAVIKELVKK
jgi:peptidyl-prolyl cis-trans isomerase SurA